MANLTVGQVLWWVSSRYRHEQPRDVTVTKVGRKWAQLDNRERIDIETLVADGGEYMPPGRCYLSQETYQAETRLIKAWRGLCEQLRHARMHDGVTVEDIEGARKLLRLAAPSQD